MPVFIVVASRDPDKVGAAVQGLEVPHLAFKDDTWLISYEGTTRELADKLGIRPGTTGAGLVCSLATYSGRTSPDVWEWLRINWPENA
jgi:hypothetical protein